MISWQDYDEAWCGADGVMDRYEACRKAAGKIYGPINPSEESRNALVVAVVRLRHALETLEQRIV